MPRDYAKNKQGGSKKAPARKKPATRKSSANRPGGGWRWYGAGVLTGVFLSFLLYLGTLPTPAESEQAQTGEAPAVESATQAAFRLLYPAAGTDHRGRR